ncbi:hypothetical protein EMCRGX_G028546 [Ephydatia muelleri]
MFGAFAKLCQRQVYSWLSSRCGLTICVVGIFLVLVSALQFGEVFLEWSKESYAAQFSIYHDNIATKSYEHQLCSELPIDVVYTWVNGSDPRLIAELKQLKRKIEEESSSCRVKNTPAVDTVNTTKAPSNEALPCPFKACIAWQTLVVDATKPHNLTLEAVQTSSPLLNSSVDYHYINSSAKHRSSVFTFRLPSEQNGNEKGHLVHTNGMIHHLTPCTPYDTIYLLLTPCTPCDTIYLHTTPCTPYDTIYLHLAPCTPCDTIYIHLAL